MSLNWNVEKVENWKEITEGDAWKVTDALIWATMAVGLGQITKGNYGEFYRRLAAYEEQEGSYLIAKDESGEMKPSPITLEEVKRRIGLSTNVGDITKKEFEAKLKRFKENYPSGGILPG